MDRVGVEPTNPQPAFLILKPDEWQQSPAQVSLTTHCLFQENIFYDIIPIVFYYNIIRLNV